MTHRRTSAIYTYHIQEHTAFSLLRKDTALGNNAILAATNLPYTPCDRRGFKSRVHVCFVARAGRSAQVAAPADMALRGRVRGATAGRFLQRRIGDAAHACATRPRDRAFDLTPRCATPEPRIYTANNTVHTNLTISTASSTLWPLITVLYRLISILKNVWNLFSPKGKKGRRRS